MRGIPSHIELLRQIQEANEKAIHDGVIVPFTMELSRIIDGTEEVVEAILHAYGGETINKFRGDIPLIQLLGSVINSESIMGNLLGPNTNRIKYSMFTGATRIERRSDDTCIFVTVKDNPSARRYLRTVGMIYQASNSDRDSITYKYPIWTNETTDFSYNECIELIHNLRSFVQIFTTINKRLEPCSRNTLTQFPGFQIS